MLAFDRLVQDPVGFLRTDPVGQTVLVPLAIGLVLAVALRFIGGRTIGRRIAAAGIGVGFLAAMGLMFEVPQEVPPTNVAGRLFWIGGIGLALGLATDIVGWTRSGTVALAVLLPAAVVTWLALPAYATLWPTALLLFAASVFVHGILAVAREGIDEPAQRSAALFPPLLVLAATATIVLLTWEDGSGFAVPAVALGAATTGYLLSAWGFVIAGARPLRFETTGMMGAAGVLLAIASFGLLGRGKLDPVAAAIALLAFVVHPRARQIALAVLPGGGVLSRIVQPISYSIVIAIPGAAAIAYTKFAPMRFFFM